jgi:acyl-CoA dehydrogenase
MSEPDAGSDLWSMRTTAVRDGDDWVINGGKHWTSWVTDADFLFVFAITDKEQFAARKGGISYFFVPTDTPG